MNYSSPDDMINVHSHSETHRASGKTITFSKFRLIIAFCNLVKIRK